MNHTMCDDDPIVRKCTKCKNCTNLPSIAELCPSRSVIHDDYKTTCECCENCRYQCSKDMMAAVIANQQSDSYEARFARVVQLKSLVNKAVQTSLDKKILDQKGQAQLEFYCTAQDAIDLNYFFAINECLHELFNAALVLIKVADVTETTVYVTKSTNAACDRCRRYRDRPDTHIMWPGHLLCGRCVQSMCESGDIDSGPGSYGRAITRNL